MKTSNSVELNWTEQAHKHYTVFAGKHVAMVCGKSYTIYKECAGTTSAIFTAKSRSNKDAFQRAGIKLMKFVLDN